MKSLLKVTIPALLFFIFTQAHAASGIPVEFSSQPIVITDNYKSFEKKLEIIKSAQKSLELMYYIYSNDESSSLLTSELIKAAQRGVKVKLLVDYFANYQNLDLFNALEKLGIEVKLYNGPTPNIIKDAIYLTTACSDENNVKGREAQCAEEKTNNPLVADFTSSNSSYDQALQKNTGFSGLLLSGLYGKNKDNILYALTAGGKLNLQDLINGSGGELSAEDKAKIKDLLHIYINAKKGDLGSVLKLQLALNMYPEAQELISVITKLLPVEVPGWDKNKTQDVMHLTDFLHHKMLLADHQKLIIGGRNVENSYHLKKNPSGKYTFMDTDIYIESTKANAYLNVEKSFERIWGSHLSHSVDLVFKNVPNDTGQDIQQRSKRAEQALANMQEQVNKFNLLDESYKTANESKTFNLDSQSKMTYIENLPFVAGTQDRGYGAKVDFEDQNSKNIHKILIQSLLDTCKTGKQEKVYLHHAYFLPSSGLLSALGMMTKTMDEDSELYTDDYKNLDCSKVTIKILTNSIGTTDLSPINILARIEMQELLSLAKNSKYKNKAAHLEYYEYLPPAQGVNASLHTKASILGQSRAIIGSANADIRSYFMDTNNGFLIENASGFIRDYTENIENLLHSSRTRRLDLDWLNETANFDVNKYIVYVVDQIFAEALKAGKKWPTEKRKELAVKLAPEVIGPFYKGAMVALTNFTKLNPEDEKQLREFADTNYRMKNYLKKIDEARKTKNAFDRMFMVF